MPVDNTVLSWDLVVDQNGTYETRQPIRLTGWGTPQDIGIYPTGVNGYDWELGGFSYLGETNRVFAVGSDTAETGWFIIYCEAQYIHGPAKPTVPCNVIISDIAAYVHFTTGGWAEVQSEPASGGIGVGRFLDSQAGNSAYALPVTDLGGGAFRVEAPPIGFCDHGWPQARGGFAAGTVDGVFYLFKMHVDQPNANKIAAGGIDWWRSLDAPFPENVGYQQSIWVRLDQTPRWITNTAMPLSVLMADPPPPMGGVAVSPAPTGSPPVALPTDPPTTGDPSVGDGTAGPPPPSASPGSIDLGLSGAFADTGPFYLAYVTDDSVAFNPAVHNVMDEYVFSWKRILTETDKPVLEVEMRNPHIGVLNASRKQWAWLSWLNPATSTVQPLFLGRIVGNPNNAFAEIITVSFVSWPSDFFKQRQTLAEQLKVAPYWDEVFIPVEKSDDPDTVLEARSSLWCVDPITLHVTAEDIIDGSAGNIDITDHFYDSLDMHDGDAPLTAVLMDATVSWTQTGRGYIDMGNQVIQSYSGDGIISEWPKPLTQLGSGWSVQNAIAIDSSHTDAMTVATIGGSWVNRDKEHSDGDALSLSWSLTAPASANVEIKSKIITAVQQTGFLDPFAVDGDGDPDPTNIPASYHATTAYVPQWVVNTSLRLRYDMSRQRTERVRILLEADLQSVVNDPLVTQNSETITMNGRDVGVPIVDVRNWTTVASSVVTVGEIIFPDDPLLPGGRSAQVAVTGGTTGSVEPEFSDIPGDYTTDGTAVWISLGTQNPTEGAQDWTGLTGFNAGAIILPRYPLWAELSDITRFGQIQVPPVATPISLGEVVHDGNFKVCTVDGIVGGPAGADTAVFGDLGPVLPDGKTYFIARNSGTSGALYVTPQFGSHSAVGDSVNDNGIVWTSIGSGDIPAGGTPGNVWARIYFPRDRGRKSLEYLMAIQRAHIRKRARAVEIEFTVPFAEGIAINCRKTVTIHDSRIPGGIALGKVTRAELSANGDTGVVECHATIGCAVGRAKAFATVAGTPVYASAGYMQSGYQQEVGGIEVLPDHSDVGYTRLTPAPNDDGLRMPLSKAQVVLSESLVGTLIDQEAAVDKAFAAMSAAAVAGNSPVSTIDQAVARAQSVLLLSADSLAVELQAHPLYYSATLKPVVNGPFWSSYKVTTQKMTVPMGINLEGSSTP